MEHDAMYMKLITERVQSRRIEREARRKASEKIKESRKAMRYHKTIKRFGCFFPKVKAKYVKKLKDLGYEYMEYNNISSIRKARK